MCEMLNEEEKCIAVNYLYEDGDNVFAGKMLRISNNEETKHLTARLIVEQCCLYHCGRQIFMVTGLRFIA